MKNCVIVVLVTIILGLMVYCNHVREEYQKKEDTLIMMYNSKCDHSKIDYIPMH